MFDCNFSFHLCKMPGSYARISSNHLGFINEETESERTQTGDLLKTGPRQCLLNDGFSVLCSSYCFHITNCLVFGEEGLI